MIRNTYTPRSAAHTGPRYGTKIAAESARLADPLRPTRSIVRWAREELYYAERADQRALEVVRASLIGERQ